MIEGDGSRWINQIHRDDAAAALVAFVQLEVRGLFNVADDEPMTQRAVYEWLAEHFQKALPPAGPIPTDRKRGWTNKRVSNAKLRALGWAPAYPSFRTAVAEEDARLA
jgi:nucleoside-diphosphate-sugar epimerase